MKTHQLAGLAASVLLGLTSVPALAQHGHGHGGHGRPGMGHGPHHPGFRPPPPRPPMYRPDPPMRRWGRGEVVPYPYRGPQYVVGDWRRYHLAPPPRGYHWVSVGPDYFLVGVATGIVLQSILN